MVHLRAQLSRVSDAVEESERHLLSLELNRWETNIVTGDRGHTAVAVVGVIGGLSAQMTEDESRDLVLVTQNVAKGLIWCYNKQFKT